MPGATVRELWVAIKKKCMDCSGFQPKEVRLCTVKRCNLWPYRMGKDHQVELGKSEQKPIQITPKSAALKERNISTKTGVNSQLEDEIQIISLA